MTTTGETATPTRTRLRQWAIRRGRQLRRGLVGLLFVMACGVVGVFIWRWVSLIGLPDIGDPFDVAAVNPSGLPPDRDAFVLFRQARDAMTEMPTIDRAKVNLVPDDGWAKADPRLREWVESNRRAHDLFHRAAEQEDGVAHPVEEWESTFSMRWVLLTPFVWMGLLEGSRHEERGEMAAAWDEYRALLAMRAHILRRGSFGEREFMASPFPWVTARITSWAADPRTTTDLVRRALDVARQTAPRPEWDASSVKVEYLLAMRELDKAESPLNDGVGEGPYTVFGEKLAPNLSESVGRVHRFLLNEPERGRRVLRMAFANWAAHADDPDEAHRRPVARLVFNGMGQATVSIFAPGPSAPASVRAISPHRLAAWLFRSRDARHLLNGRLWPAIRARERRDHDALLVALATELYRRERGGPPPGEQALVGPYLDRLPDDGLDDLDDGTIESIREVEPPQRPGRPQ